MAKTPTPAAVKPPKPSRASKPTKLPRGVDPTLVALLPLQDRLDTVIGPDLDTLRAQVDAQAALVAETKTIAHEARATATKLAAVAPPDIDLISKNLDRHIINTDLLSANLDASIRDLNAKVVIVDRESAKLESIRTRFIWAGVTAAALSAPGWIALFGR